MDPESIKKLREVPFYKPPERVKTSGEIVRDAKWSLQNPHRPLPLSTRRPETPLDENRRLFRQNSAKDLTHRPPSTFSLGSRHFDPESRPSSGNIRLTPLQVEPKIHSHSSESDLNRIVPRPPPDPNRPIRKTSSRSRLYVPPSDADAVVRSEFATRGRCGSLKDVSDLNWSSSAVSESCIESARRVHSGPKERTSVTAQDESFEDTLQCKSLSISAKKNRNDLKLRNASFEAGKVESRDVNDDAARDLSAHSYKTTSAGKHDGVQRNQRKETHIIASKDETTRKTFGGGGVVGQRVMEIVPVVLENNDQKNGSQKSMSEKRASDDGDSYYQTVIAPLIDEMSIEAQAKNVEKLSKMSTILYSLLESGNLLGKSCRQRSIILKSIYQLLDLDSPQLLLNLSRLILAMKVSGKNLLNVCKLIFKVSSDNKNDGCFLKDNITDLLVETSRNIELTSPDAHESLIYCLGALKFLSGNSTIVKLLATKQHTESLAQILSTVNKMSRSSGNIGDQVGILLQLTMVLRNLADVSGTKRYFILFGLIDELCEIMNISTNNQELMLNICRTLSKLTLHTDCCVAVAKNPAVFKSFLELLKKYKNWDDLVLRVGFILGNLMAKQEDAREHLFNWPHALDILLDVFHCYSERDVALNKENTAETRSEAASRIQKKVEDVLVKIVRVIANVSISQDVGEMVAKNDECIELLLQVLGQKNLESSEELVLNVMATINNLSFYNLHDSSINKNRLRIARALLKFVEVKHKESLAETTRVFGNLSRDRDVRDFLVKHKIDEAIVALLDSGNRELVFAACGVLINLMTDEDKRLLLRHEDGINKLIGVLQEFGRSDWQLAGMVCQTLWNFSSKITSTSSCFGEEAAQELIDILTEYLDDDAVAEDDTIDEEMKDYIHNTWKMEFLPVASDLLQRIEEHQSHLEPLKHMT